MLKFRPLLSCLSSLSRLARLPLVELKIVEFDLPQVSLVSHTTARVSDPLRLRGRQCGVMSDFALGKRTSQELFICVHSLVELTLIAVPCALGSDLLATSVTLSIIILSRKR